MVLFSSAVKLHNNLSVTVCSCCTSDMKWARVPKESTLLLLLIGPL